MDLRDIRRPILNVFSNAEVGRIPGFEDPVQEVRCTTSAVSVPPTLKIQFTIRLGFLLHIADC